MCNVSWNIVFYVDSKEEIKNSDYLSGDGFLVYLCSDESKGFKYILQKELTTPYFLNKKMKLYHDNLLDRLKELNSSATVKFHVSTKFNL